MTVYGVITAAIVRKLRALVAEIRSLVSEANQTEEQIATTVKTETVKIYTEAKQREYALVSIAEAKVNTLKSDLIDRIAKL